MSPEIIEITTTRANPLIDPQMHIWGWEIPVYLFLGGVVAGLMILLAALELKRDRQPTSAAAQLLPFAAIGLISAGMLALLLDLENPGNVLRFYLSFEPTSPMSWGAWLLLAVYPILLLLGLGGLDDDRLKVVREHRLIAAMRLGRIMDGLTEFARSRRGLVIRGSLVAGISLGVYTGLLLGTLSARPLWNTSILGPLFLVSGISTAAALMLLFGLDDGEKHLILRWDIAAIALELAFLMVLVLGYGTGSEAARTAGEVFLGGAYTPHFWSLVVIGGLLVPLALELLHLRKKIAPTALAPILILAGGLALRAVIVAAGQATSFVGLG